MSFLIRPILALAIAVLIWEVPPSAQADELSKIRAIPPQIILGALDYGQTKALIVRFKLTVEGIPSKDGLTQIDCRQASGISVISKRKEGSDTIVELEADLQQLCAGQHYGAFIKKQIRLETDDLDQPQFVVPVVGWLDVNRSTRNFSQYVFQQKPRWQGPWPTPNVAGAILVSFTLIVIGLAGTILKKIRRNGSTLPILGFGLAMTGTVWLLWLLCSTYSREAWLAFFIACGAMAIFSTQLRIPALVAVGIFFVVLCCIPAGVQRLESYGQVDSDLSIANRFRLWTGALQIMADYPFTGVGTGRFPFAFERDYQPFSYTAQTSSAVSDFLTFGAEHGILVLSILLGLLLLLLSRALVLCRESDKPPLMVLTAVLLGLLTTSCFSTLWVVPDYRWIAGVTLGGLLCYTVLNELRKREGKSVAFQMILQSSKWTLVTCFVFLFICEVSVGVQPTRLLPQAYIASDSRSVPYNEIVPRWTNPKGTVLYLADLSEEATLSHSTLRPMAAMGWQVIPVSCSANPESVRDLISALRQTSPARDIFLAGESKGAKLAWRIASEESPSVVKAGGGFDFLSSDMDAPVGKGAPSQPFLVYQSLYGDGASSNPAILAQNQMAFRGLPLTVVLSEETAPHFSSAWINFLNTLNIFFDHECQRRR